MDTINQWASFHHEKISGEGYPFKLDKKDLSLGSRIMAISDVFTALTQNRPYRMGMSVEDSIAIIDKMVGENHLDGDAVGVFKQNIDEINYLKVNAQNATLKRHGNFLCITVMP